MYPRHLLPLLKEALLDTPVVMLVGARQVGKSTLAHALVPSEWRITLDDFTALDAARRDPAAFVAALPFGALLDEVQRAPDVLLALKALVDRDRRPGRLVLTGSADVLTLPKVSESLAGRMEVHRLWGLSQGELAGRHEDFAKALFGEALPPATAEDDLVPRVLRGGYPEAVARPSGRRRDAWFDSYMTTLMERDVRDLSRISGLAELPRLMTLLALRCGKLLNASDLARDAGLNNVTLTRYFELLRALYLVETLPAWSTNATRRLIKAPKIVVPDSGLAAHLAGLSLEALTRDRLAFGPLLENFVLGELARQRGWSSVPFELFHYRAASGQEVDAVLEARDGRICGIEVKAAATVTNKDFVGLRALAEDAADRFVRGVVLYGGEATVAFGPFLLAVPLPALWQWSNESQG